ncbi:MAG: MerR family transcriptional regulator [Gammaproteobacteria bacterium]|jgi:chaperone modulatory protein CbpM|nr:MerR family transcriptional regulator [Gammaproteobacteria bacterium]
MNSKKTKLLSGDLIGEDEEITLEQLCRACELSEQEIIQLVDQGILEPMGPEPAEWRFVSVSLRRVRITRNLQRDLGVNAPGAALALELLEEIEELRSRLRQLET